MQSCDTVTLHPLHAPPLWHVALQKGLFYILHLWCFSCSACQARPRGRDDGEGKQCRCCVMRVFATAGQCHTAHSTRRRYALKSHNRGGQRGKIHPCKTRPPLFPFHRRYQQKNVNSERLSATWCQIITGSGAAWVLNAHQNPSPGRPAGAAISPNKHIYCFLIMWLSAISYSKNKHDFETERAIRYLAILVDLDVAPYLWVPQKRRALTHSHKIFSCLLCRDI